MAETSAAASWRQRGLLVLTTADPALKCRAAIEACRSLTAGDLTSAGSALTPPDRPARPPRPVLLPARAMPKRRLGAPDGRARLLHALAHIELNAVDLAFDMALRFEQEIAAAGCCSDEFAADWFRVGADEARHFMMLNDRLGALDARYGSFAAHDSLWEAAAATSDSVLARLAIAPMVLEARGLDVTPAMAERLKDAGDPASADLLATIYTDEITHVSVGVRWFEAICAKRGLDPRATFSGLVAARFEAGLKPPFNRDGRSAAGLDEAYYREWNEPCEARGTEWSTSR